MRIAVSGAHATGKSTLVAALARHFKDAIVEDEAYYALLEEGVEFADPPDAGDYERMFDRACAQVQSVKGERVIFDRTSADYLAYLLALREDPRGTDWPVRARDAALTLDLVIFVPIEEPDRIDGAEHPRLRATVDRILRDLWIEDSWDWGARVVEVSGSVEERVRQVVAALA